VLQIAACIRLFVALFVDSLPSPDRLENLGYTAAVHRLLSAVHRLTGWKARAAAVCRPRSAVHLAVCRLLFPFVYSFPYSLTVIPTVHRLIAVCRPRSAVWLAVCCLGSTVSFVQEIRSESPESHEKTSVSRHCERSMGKAISWPIGGLLRRLRRLAM